MRTPCRRKPPADSSGSHLTTTVEGTAAAEVRYTIGASIATAAPSRPPALTRTQICLSHLQGHPRRRHPHGSPLLENSVGRSTSGQLALQDGDVFCLQRVTAHNGLQGSQKSWAVVMGDRVGRPRALRIPPTKLSPGPVSGASLCANHSPCSALVKSERARLRALGFFGSARAPQAEKFGQAISTNGDGPRPPTAHLPVAPLFHEPTWQGCPVSEPRSRACRRRSRSRSKSTR